MGVDILVVFLIRQAQLNLEKDRALVRCPVSPNVKEKEAEVKLLVVLCYLHKQF